MAPLTEMKTCLSCKYLSDLITIGVWSTCNYPVKYPACANSGIKEIVLTSVHRKYPYKNCDCWEPKKEKRCTCYVEDARDVHLLPNEGERCMVCEGIR